MDSSEQLRVLGFTKDSARDFYKLYEEAKAHGNETFMFKGHEFLTNYAHYVVEYLKEKGLL